MLLAEHEAIQATHFLERDVPAIDRPPLRAVARGARPRRVPPDRADRPGRHGQRLARGAVRRPLRGAGRGEAAQHRPRRTRGGGTLPSRRHDPRAPHAPEHRAPHRRRRVAEWPAVPGARARQRAEHRSVLRRARARNRGPRAALPRRPGRGRPRARQRSSSTATSSRPTCSSASTAASSCSTSASPS